MSTLDAVRGVLNDTLKLGDRIDGFDAATPLLGAVPEFDSMAVVTIITALEDSFGIEFEDDEITGATFETVGSLSDLVDEKLNS